MVVCRTLIHASDVLIWWVCRSISCATHTDKDGNIKLLPCDCIQYHFICCCFRKCRHQAIFIRGHRYSVLHWSQTRVNSSLYLLGSGRQLILVLNAGAVVFKFLVHCVWCILIFVAVAPLYWISNPLRDCFTIISQKPILLPSLSNWGSLSSVLQSDGSGFDLAATRYQNICLNSPRRKHTKRIIG